MLFSHPGNEVPDVPILNDWAIFAFFNQLSQLIQSGVCLLLLKQPDSGTDDFTLIGKITGFNHVVNKSPLFIGGPESNGSGHDIPQK